MLLEAPSWSTLFTVQSPLSGQWIGDTDDETHACWNMHIMIVNDIVMGLFLEHQSPPIEGKGEIRGLIWVTWLKLPTLVLLYDYRGLGHRLASKVLATITCFCHLHLPLSCLFIWKGRSASNLVYTEGEFGDTGGLVEHTVVVNGRVNLRAKDQNHGGEELRLCRTVLCCVALRCVVLCWLMSSLMARGSWVYSDYT